MEANCRHQWKEARHSGPTSAARKSSPSASEACPYQAADPAQAKAASHPPSVVEGNCPVHHSDQPDSSPRRGPATSARDDYWIWRLHQRLERACSEWRLVGRGPVRRRCKGHWNARRGWAPCWRRTGRRGWDRPLREPLRDVGCVGRVFSSGLLGSSEWRALWISGVGCSLRKKSSAKTPPRWRTVRIRFTWFSISCLRWSGMTWLWVGRTSRTVAFEL